MSKTSGLITVDRISSQIISCRASGHLTMAHAVAAQASIEQLAAGRAHDMLYDGSAIEAFEPGLPVAWVRWSLGRSTRPGRVAVVGRPGPSLSIANTFRYLLPGLRIALFTDRLAAIEFLEAKLREPVE